MKKFLLSVVIACCALGASAFDYASLPKYDAGMEPIVGPAPADVQSRATSTNIQFCGSLAGWLKAPVECDEIFVYIPVPACVATALAGNSVTKITFSASLASAVTLPGTVFVTEDPNGAPITTKDTNIRNCKGSSLPQQSVTLSEKYTIKENTPFYFGYSVKNISVAKDYPIGACESNTPLAGFVQPVKNGVSLGFGSMGYDLYAYATTEGSKTTLDGCAVVTGTAANDFTLPVVTVGDPVTAQVAIWNLGGKVSSLEYSYSVAGSEPVAGSAQVNLPAKSTASVKLPAGTAALGRNDINVRITKLGSYDIDIEAAVPVIGLPETADKPRAFLVEEFTGSWCGWCPRGIVGFERMEAAYPDDFIGVAIHDGDNMKVACYSNVLNLFCNGYPGCVINRDPKYNMDPSYSTLSSNYTKVWSKQKAPVAIEWGDVMFSADHKSLTANVSTIFEYDEADAQYAVAIAVTESSIMGAQTNYYSGGGSGAMGGWENKDDPALWSYSHVARQITDEMGKPGTVPATIVAATANPCSIEVPLANVYDVAHIENVIAMVMDQRTGVVLNASSIPLSEVKEYTGLGSVAVAAAATVTGGKGSISVTGNYRSVSVYTLSGMAVGRTRDLAPGVYVVNVDGRAHKVVVR